jgi:hypothetical protein
MDFRRLAYQYAERNGIPHSFNKNTELAGEGFIRNFLKRNPSLSIRTPVCCTCCWLQQSCSLRLLHPSGKALERPEIPCKQDTVEDV